MGQVTSLFLIKVMDAFEGDIDKSDLLNAVGISPEKPVDPSFMLSSTDYYAAFRKLAKADRHGWSLPLRAGASMRCADYGAFGLAWKSANNIKGSFERAERYARLLTNVASYQIETTRSGAFMHLHRQGERHLGMRLSNEATIASIHAISREVATKDFHPLEVHFKHSAPAVVADHQRYFECPVFFDSDRDALLVSVDTLNTPNFLGDESLSQFFDTHLEGELSKLTDDNSVEQRIKIYVSRNLSEGIPPVSAIAEHLCMSSRTLQRRLADSGQTYQRLLDESRRSLAEKLLRQTTYSLNEIAFMAGFSDQSAFNRAFKRWAGQTPRSFRIVAR
jgi:AraC-like DNA-binding protein